MVFRSLDSKFGKLTHFGKLIYFGASRTLFQMREMQWPLSWINWSKMRTKTTESTFPKSFPVFRRFSIDFWRSGVRQSIGRRFDRHLKIWLVFDFLTLSAISVIFAGFYFFCRRIRTCRIQTFCQISAIFADFGLFVKNQKLPKVKEIAEKDENCRIRQNLLKLGIFHILLLFSAFFLPASVILSKLQKLPKMAKISKTRF